MWLGLDSVPGRDTRTDGQTDRQNFRSEYTLSAQYLPVQLSR